MSYSLTRLNSLAYQLGYRVEFDDYSEHAYCRDFVELTALIISLAVTGEPLVSAIHIKRALSSCLVFRVESTTEVDRAAAQAAIDYCFGLHPFQKARFKPKILVENRPLGYSAWYARVTLEVIPEMELPLPVHEELV